MRLSLSIIVVALVVVALVVVAAVVTVFKLGTLDVPTSTSEVDRTAEVVDAQREQELAEPDVPETPAEPDTFNVVVKFSGTELEGPIIAGLFNSEEGCLLYTSPSPRD